MRKETVITTGTYRRCTIAATNLGRYIVTIEGLSYPAYELKEAKDMIDGYWKTKGN